MSTPSRAPSAQPLLAAAVVAATLSLSLPAMGAAAHLSTGETVGAAASALPPQGMYEGCAPRAGEACIERLRAIRAAGFRYVLNYSAWYGSEGDVLSYADAAGALGLQLIWPLNHPAWRGRADLGATYPDLAASLAGGGPGENRDVVTFAISLVASHPGTWGFYIGDELSPAEAGSVATLSAAVRALAPGSPQLYVSRPGAALLAPFAPLADVAGIDAYPIGSGDPPIRQAARTAKAVAVAAGAAPAMTLQAFSWSQYRPAAGPDRYPTAGELRTMRDAAIQHAEPSMILWYSYQDVLRSDRPWQRWRELTWAAFGQPPTPFAMPDDLGLLSRR
jgi:hypothetical protein